MTKNDIVNSRSRVLVTGANGFIGEKLCRELYLRGYAVREVTQKFLHPPSGRASACHARRSGCPLEEFRRVNTAGTEQLARSAAASGVKRLVNVSSIKVNGEETNNNPFSEEDTPSPQDPYGI